MRKVGVRHGCGGRLEYICKVINFVVKKRLNGFLLALFNNKAVTGRVYGTDAEGLFASQMPEVFVEESRC